MKSLARIATIAPSQRYCGSVSRPVCVLAIGLIVVSSAAAQAARPTLRLVSLSPTTVAGVHFQGKERVRVRLRTNDRSATRHVVATRLGKFVVTFGSKPFDPCNSSLSVTAVGARGSRAAVKLPQRECPPA